MQRIDKAILDVSKVIDENILAFSSINRGLLSQNILSNLRNFVECVMMKIHSSANDDFNPHDYRRIDSAIDETKKRGDLRFLYEFHAMIQKSVSHYTIDKDGSERLMLKYYQYFLMIKSYLKKHYNLDVLLRIEEFPVNTDSELSDYYIKIAERIDSPKYPKYDLSNNERYYIMKVKPFFVNYMVYYEVTFTAANSKGSKFDRLIAFTKLDIMDNYAVKLSLHSDIISVLNKRMSILVIDHYEVAIRPCEFNNLSVITGHRLTCNAKSIEYKELMRFITSVKMSLTELLSGENDYYNSIRRDIIKKAHSRKIFRVLNRCRRIIVKNQPGSNVLRYLLYKMNNRIIKCQLRAQEPCSELSNLCLWYGCIPFDQMPFCTSLPQHNPKASDLLDAIPVANREHEQLARFIHNNTEFEGVLFTPQKELEGYERVGGLISQYNRALYSKHQGRRIEVFKSHLFIKEYVDDCTAIIRSLKDLSSSGVLQYTESVDSWLSRGSYSIDDVTKKETLRQVFAKSHVALIYGSAGTGKTTLINHISNFFERNDKLYLANTHPAVDNLRRKTSAGNSQYCTIAKFLSDQSIRRQYDIVFIDECSTVSNKDMCQLLRTASFELLVLVGDVYQIESITFGNWFNNAKHFVAESSVFELKHPYRTKKEELLKVWDLVRKSEDSMLESLVCNGFVARLDESIFEHNSNDEIILCLNYDGLYGVNNLNRILQNTNPSDSVLWGLNTYKVNDPILFNESNRFAPLVHNNTKGKIVAISVEDRKIWFSIELEKTINEIDAKKCGLQLVGISEDGKSIVSFSVNQYRNSDEDDDDNNSTVVPFQVSYAVSIHKAQGLEYESVKIVITNEVEEQITHSIFYTAITRAKNMLKIYWSPETENSVLNRIKEKHVDGERVSRDARLLAQISNLQLNKDA